MFQLRMYYRQGQTNILRRGKGGTAAGWDEEMVLRNYPALTPEAIRAVFAFAQECTREATVHDATEA